MGAKAFPKRLSPDADDCATQADTQAVQLKWYPSEAQAADHAAEQVANGSSVRGGHRVERVEVRVLPVCHLHRSSAFSFWTTHTSK